jgi:two-component system capsular synthesis sensor histidine kinase RcsC
MGVMDGYELLATLRRLHPGLPVLAFSAVTDTQQTEEWHQRGFAGHIAKPTSLKDLEVALSALGANEDEAAEPAQKAALEPGVAPSPQPGIEPQRAADFADSLDAQTRARYIAMLKAGGFLIVGEPQFAAQCRELQNLCQGQEQWSEQMAGLAIVLHEGLRHHYGLDETSMH